MSTQPNHEKATLLLYRGSHALQRLYRSYLDEWGITHTQFFVLRQLWEENGKSVTDLARPLDLDSGTLSPMLRRMERDNLVEGRRIDLDFRVRRFYTTPRSEAILEQFDAIDADIARQLKITDREVQQLEKLIAKIAARTAER